MFNKVKKKRKIYINSSPENYFKNGPGVGIILGSLGYGIIGDTYFVVVILNNLATEKITFHSG